MNINILQNNAKFKMEGVRPAIVVNLYYEQNLQYYLKFLYAVPKEIDVYIFSSNYKVINILKDRCLENEGIKIIYKKNRGRDISALLVAFRPYVFRYSYICFLHDKKAKYQYLEEDLKIWIDNLWGNMIYSEEYIWNAIKMMENEGYGVLIPPKPVGEYMDTAYSDVWRNDFDLVISLAAQLKLEYKINYDSIENVSIGTAFWCSVKAMKKLFEYNWKYEDFPDEPMPKDGTISHAIERVLGFVALDAGYKVTTIMNSEYASNYLALLQDKLSITYDWLIDKVGVKNTYQLVQLEKDEKAIVEIVKKYKNIYIYGAGFFGKLCLKRMLFWGYYPIGYIVSDGMKIQNTYCGYPVYELREIDDLKHIGVIVAVNYELQSIIVKELQKKGIKHYYIATFLE